MVLLVSLDDDDIEESKTSSRTPPIQDDLTHDVGDARPNPNINHGFSAALSCYPIVSQLASQLDLNSLHDLSRTCRQFRANLTQYRQQLIALSLRCDNEDETPATRLGNALSASYQIWTAYGHDGAKIGRITSGKIGACARDMVGECRRCSQVVCRNCIMKSPAQHMLRGRHRRLCRTCMKSPLDRHMKSIAEVDGDDCALLNESFTTSIARSPCTCTKEVWICSPCGQSLRSADTTYIRGWSWRTRYSCCGGFGAGLGEGVEGVECGRGKACLEARYVEKEVECDAVELAAIEAETEKAGLEGHVWAGSSYTTQEMVGIGGQVKKKVKKMVTLGAVVKEYEDERADGTYLRREQDGVNRSWCCWCDRIVPSKRDIERPAMSTDSIASCSSSDASA